MTEFLLAKGMTVLGIDNDMRSYYFGKEASTSWRVEGLKTGHPNYRHHSLDVRDQEAIDGLFREHGGRIGLVVHAAAQPSHDWAAREPLTDFHVNANGTHILLEAVKKFSPQATFVFLSTNKVYGDTPNALPLVEMETRWEIEAGHRFAARGIDETMSVDSSTHSLFGVSKLAADLLVQEYGRYFGINTACFRAGCLTGGGHSGAELHGFLSYLMKCTVTGRPYQIFGYKGKQVRDNIHSADLVSAIWHFAQRPKPAAVYNIGGGRRSNCSMLEAIAKCEELASRKLNWTYVENNRVGDHIWWISDLSRFQNDYPEFAPSYDLDAILADIHGVGANRWTSAP